MKTVYIAFALSVLFAVFFYWDSDVYSTKNVESLGLAERAQKRPAELTEFLKEIGTKYDYYFTLETAIKDGNVDTSLEKVKIEPASNVGTVSAELERIRQVNSDFTYDFDERNEKVIHVVDKRLTKLKDYPLQRIIPSIHFEGGLADFVEALGQKEAGVSSRALMDIRDASFLDYSTRVNVREKHKSVRYLLTNAVESRDRSRLLWIARTDLDRSAPTFVRYLR